MSTTPVSSVSCMQTSTSLVPVDFSTNQETSSLDNYQAGQVPSAPGKDSLFRLGSFSAAMTVSSDAKDPTAMSAEDKASEIHALMKHGLSAKEQDRVVKILLATQDVELTKLKNLIDSQGDYFDFKFLVNNQLSKKNQDVVYNHIATEGAKVRASFGDKVPLIPLVDVDDTFKDWMYDNRLAGATIYPGVEAFIDVLMQSTKETGRKGCSILTARADFLEEYTHHDLHKHVPESFVESGFDVNSTTILTGGLNSLTLLHKLMAASKDRNYAVYKKLFPEYNFTFISDDSLADQDAGRRWLDEKNPRTPAVFIMDTMHRKTLKGTTVETKGFVEENHLYYYDDYVGGALAARDAGLITDDQLKEVVEMTIAHIHDLDQKGLARGKSYFLDSRFKDAVARDLKIVNQLLGTDYALS